MNTQLQTRQVSDDVLLQQYQHLATLAEPAIQQWAAKQASSHLSHCRKVCDVVERYASGGRLQSILDIGSVPGFIPYTLRQRGHTVTAVDINPSRVQGIFDEADVPAYAVDVEKEPLPFADETFDFVLFNEILEHLRLNPLYAAQEASRVLRAGGRLLLSTPNITPLRRLEFLFGKDYQGDIVKELEKLDTVGHMGHFRLYSIAEVHRLMRASGLDICATERYGHKRKRKLRAVILKMAFPRKMRSRIYVVGRKPHHQPRGGTLAATEATE